MKYAGTLSYLEPLETTARGVAVIDALAEMINRARLGVGDRLPPEVAMATTLGVGRSTIREALNRWEGLGIIRRRRGDGTYLTARVQSSGGPVPTMIRMEGEALLRLLEVRRALETAIVRAAALKATPAQREEISRLYEALVVVVERGESYISADAAFHAAISDATGNPMFGQILSRLNDALERSQNSPFSRSGFGLRSLPHHLTLSDAINRGDVDRAAAAITAIIDAVEEEIRQIIAPPNGKN